MNALHLVASFVTVVVCGCTSTVTPQSRAQEEEVVRQAALLDTLSYWDTNRVVFVAFRVSRGHLVDPSDKVIARIRAKGIPARKASEASRDEHETVIDKTNGQPGVIYYAGVQKWISDSKVEVIESADYSSLGGWLNEIIMQKRSGKWVPTEMIKMVGF